MALISPLPEQEYTLHTGQDDKLISVQKNICVNAVKNIHLGKTFFDNTDTDNAF